MHGFYAFITGPMVWVAFIVFVSGCLYRILSLLLTAHKKEHYLFSYMSFKYGLRSVMMWMIPFATVNMRRQPVMTGVSFVFHVCLVLAPVFLLSHVVLLEEAWNLSWFALDDGTADVMTVLVILSCLYFAYRRIRVPVVRYVSSAQDYVVLAMVALPFLTGFLAYHQVCCYQLMLSLHIVSGEVMLMAIPFTRLGHMITGPLSRAYMGSEFGGIRNARDW